MVLESHLQSTNKPSEFKEQHADASGDLNRRVWNPAHSPDSPMIQKAQKVNDQNGREVDNILSTDRRSRNQHSIHTAIDGLTSMGAADPYKLGKFVSDAYKKAFTARTEKLPTEELRGRREQILGNMAMCNLHLEGRPIGRRELPSIPGLDLGANCLVGLVQVKRNIDETTKLIDSLKGLTVDGKIIDDKEKQDLLSFARDITPKIEAIEGGHGLDSAKSTLKSFMRPSVYLPLFDSTQRGNRRDDFFLQGDSAHADFHNRTNLLMESVLKRAQESGIEISSDPETTRLLSKIFRDQALVSLALAEGKLENGDSQGASDLIFGRASERHRPLSHGQYARGYDGVLETIELAAKLQPNNPDLLKLKTMTDDFRVKLLNLGSPRKNA